MAVCGGLTACGKNANENVFGKLKHKLIAGIDRDRVCQQLTNRELDYQQEWNLIKTGLLTSVNCGSIFRGKIYIENYQCMTAKTGYGTATERKKGKQRCEKQPETQ